MAADRDGARRLAGRRRAGHPRRPAGARVIGAGGDTVTFTANPIDDATVLDVWRWSPDGLDAAHRRATACTARPSAATRWWCARTTLAEPGASTAVVDGPTLAASAERPLVHAERHPAPRHGGRALADGRAAPPRPRRLAAAGAARPVRRPARPAGRGRAQRLPHVAVVRRPGLRRRRHRRSGHAGPRAGVGARRAPRPGDRGARRPGRRAAGRGRRASARPVARRHPRLELRRLPRRARRAAPPRRVPRRRSPARPSPSGGCTTRTTRSATSATRASTTTPYAATSLLPLAGDLTRPLLLVHGLADDNVVAAHTLQLSSALLAAGKPHEVLPLVGVTHMTPQEVVAENLLLHQLDFLRRSLGTRRSGVTRRVAATSRSPIGGSSVAQLGRVDRLVRDVRSRRRSGPPSPTSPPISTSVQPACVGVLTAHADDGGDLVAHDARAGRGSAPSRSARRPARPRPRPPAQRRRAGRRTGSGHRWDARGEMRSTR